MYLLHYVDDIVLTVSSSELLHWAVDTINTEFKLKDMGPVHYSSALKFSTTIGASFSNSSSTPSTCWTVPA